MCGDVSCWGSLNRSRIEYLINTVDPIQIFVPGEPQPFPKTHTAIIERPGQKPRLVPVATDYRTRTNPYTHKVEKYDRGYKAAWMKTVTQVVNRYMVDRDLNPFPKNHPVAMGCLFFLTKSPSCKLEFPSQDPDEDNLLYAIRNALKRTQKKKGGHGKYPDGVLFYEDNQIVWILEPQGKIWATSAHPPGLIITVQNALSPRVRCYLDGWQPNTQKVMELHP